MMKTYMRYSTVWSCFKNLVNLAMLIAIIQKTGNKSTFPQMLLDQYQQKPGMTRQTPAGSSAIDTTECLLLWQDLLRSLNNTSFRSMNKILNQDGNSIANMTQTNKFSILVCQSSLSNLKKKRPKMMERLSLSQDELRTTFFTHSCLRVQPHLLVQLV